MGDNAVYKEQFYTKLVISCSCTYIYIYAAFLFVSLKTHESKRSYSMPAHARSNSELADVLLILSPRRHVVSLLLSETYLGHEMIKDHARPPGRR